jgi:pyruvate/2-oxoglutarate dehydrogenase complex dihydrolipoamide dehydrogenase (E3) component
VVSKLTGGVKILLKANGCDYRTGVARLTWRNTVSHGGGRQAARDVQADNTSSRLPAADEIGLQFDGQRIVDSTGRWRSTPSGGSWSSAAAIGIEIGTLYAKLGRRSPSSRRCRDPDRQRSDIVRWWRASSRSWASR